MWTALSVTWVTCCATIGAVIVPLLPNVVRKRESSGNCCPPTPPGTTRLRCTTRHCPFGCAPRWRNVGTWELKRGNWVPLAWYGFPAMTTAWSTGSVPPQIEKKHVRLRYSKRWHCVYYSIPSKPVAQMVWIYTACHVLYQICHGLNDPGTRRHGRPRKLLFECQKNCVNKCGQSGVDLHHRHAWGVGIWGCLVLSIPSNIKMNVINDVECCKWCRSEEDLIVPDPTFSSLLKKEFSCVKSRFIHLQAIWPRCVIMYYFCIVKDNLNEINSYSSLAPNRRQAIIWTNDGLVYWRMYALLGTNELMFQGIFYYIDVFILGVYFDAKHIISHMMLTKTLSQQFYMIYR